MSDSRSVPTGFRRAPADRVHELAGHARRTVRGHGGEVAVVVALPALTGTAYKVAVDVPPNVLTPVPTGSATF
ncbi:MAG TPA: hypothetical protein VGF24_00835 [Vicinamibacterales bacterium]